LSDTTFLKDAFSRLTFESIVNLHCFAILFLILQKNPVNMELKNIRNLQWWKQENCVVQVVGKGKVCQLPYV